MNKLILLFVCALFFVACSNKKETVVGDLASYPDLESYDVVMRYTDSAQLQLIIETEKQVRLKSQNELFEKGMLVSFYNGLDTVQSTMVCDSSFYNREEKLWKAWGNVVIHNLVEKRTLETEYLEWKPTEHTVYTNQHVTITTPDQEIQGDGLRAKDDFSEYEIENITGIIALEE